MYLSSILAVPPVYLEKLNQLVPIFTGTWVAEVFKGKKDKDVFYFYLHLLLRYLPFVENFQDRKTQNISSIRSITKDVSVLHKCYE